MTSMSVCVWCGFDRLQETAELCEVCGQTPDSHSVTLVKAGGVRIAVAGDVPVGAGLSSSAALTVAAAKALPKLEAQEEFIEPEHQPIHAVDEDALCVR